MTVVAHQAASPKAVRFMETTQRIESALERRQHVEFVTACQERDRILTELMAEVESKGFVLFR